MAKPKQNKKKVANKKKTKISVSKRITGRGAYSIKDIASKIAAPFTHNEPSKTNVNKVARYLGSKLGDATGIPGVGSALGNAASYVSKLFGFGEYTLKKNSLTQANIAQFHDNGSIRVAHREFITNVMSSTDFVNTNYLINPGNPTIFPWLSVIAKNFEAYEFEGLVFEYRSMCATSVGSSNMGMGSVVMATDYDIMDPNYTSKPQMVINDFGVDGKPYVDQYHPIECNPKLNAGVSRQYITSTTGLSSVLSSDARFNYLGNFQLATVGMPANTTLGDGSSSTTSMIGELWVTYKVKLLKPQIYTFTDSIKTFNPSGRIDIDMLTVGNQQVPGVIQQYSDGGTALNLNMNAGTVNAFLTCQDSTGFGTYLMTVHTISSVPSGLNIHTTPQCITPAGGNAVVEAYTTGANGLRNSYSSCGSGNFIQQMTTNGIPPSFVTETGWVQSALVTFSAVGDVVVFPLPYDPNFSDPIYHTVIIAPYNTNLTKSRVSNSTQIDSLTNSLRSLEAKYTTLISALSSKDEVKEKEIDDDDDPDTDDGCATPIKLSQIEILQQQLKEAQAKLVPRSAMKSPVSDTVRSS